MRKPLVVAPLLLIFLIALSGCPHREGPAERTGRAIDEAGRSIGHAAEDVGDAVDDATH